MFEIGRVCMKTAGREAGRYCVVLKKEEPGFVLITGPKSLTKVKRRKCNVHHLEPMVKKVKIKSEASDAEVLKALKDEKVFEDLGFKVVTKGEPAKEAPKKSEPKKTEKKPEKKKAKKEKKIVKKEAAKKITKKAKKKPAKKAAKKK
jgi:large subunit ribosomal protein L14e